MKQGRDLFRRDPKPVDAGSFIIGILLAVHARCAEEYAVIVAGHLAGACRRERSVDEAPGLARLEIDLPDPAVRSHRERPSQMLLENYLIVAGQFRRDDLDLLGDVVAGVWRIQHVTGYLAHQVRGRDAGPLDGRRRDPPSAKRDRDDNEN